MNEIITAGRRLGDQLGPRPAGSGRIEPRILSRLSWGLVADINAADFELRFNILETKLARSAGRRCRADVIEFLAAAITQRP